MKVFLSGYNWRGGMLGYLCKEFKANDHEVEYLFLPEKNNISYESLD